MKVNKAIKICNSRLTKLRNDKSFSQDKKKYELSLVYENMIKSLEKLKTDQNNEELAKFFMYVDELGRLGDSKTKAKLRVLRWS